MQPLSNSGSFMSITLDLDRAFVLPPSLPSKAGHNHAFPPNLAAVRQGDALCTCAGQTLIRENLRAQLHFANSTRYQVWRRNTAGQWASDTRSSLLIELGPVTKPNSSCHLLGPAFTIPPAQKLNRPKFACDASRNVSYEQRSGEGEYDSFLASHLIYSNFMQLSFSKRKKEKHKRKLPDS